jgi:1-acyl-sn-glycerol-3-phosphate acyltransferase
MRHMIAKFFFNFGWLPAQIIFKILFHYQAENKEKLKNLKPPLIIVSNHLSYFDPFLLGAAFKFNSEVYPIRYAVAPRYYYFPLFYPFIWGFGGFPVFRKIGLENSLKAPLELLKKGKVVGIFPEGKISREGKPSKPKRGAAYLAIKTGVPILPMRIMLSGEKLTFKNVLLRKVKITVLAGEAFRLPQEIADLDKIDQATEFIMGKILSLKK